MKKKTIILSVLVYLISMFSFEFFMSMKNHSMNKSLAHVVAGAIAFLVALFFFVVFMNRERFKELLVITTAFSLMFGFSATYKSLAKDDSGNVVMQPLIDRDRTKHRTFVWEMPK